MAGTFNRIQSVAGRNHGFHGGRTVTHSPDKVLTCPRSSQLF
jgi:hypothetical protein